MVLFKCVGAFVIFLVLSVTACSARETRLKEAAVPAVETQQQAEMILTWRRQGGFAGFCDEMQISATGEVRAQSCRSRTEKTGKLSNEDLNRIGGWRKSFGSVLIELKDGGIADGMATTLSLKGTGTGQPSEAQRREMLEWAEMVYTRSKS